MLSYIRSNIEYVQYLAKQRIGDFLEGHGYSLTLDEHNKEGIETRQFQWEHPDSDRTVQLYWDGKEDWFELRFAEHRNLLYLSERTPVTIQNFRRTKLFSRKSYAANIVNNLLELLKKKIN